MYKRQVLSGCGHQDGSEIHEAVFTLHALEKAGAEAIIMAPDMDQFHVINHLNGNEDLSESRNILVESARIARGKVVDVASVSGHQLDALIFPGGTGMAKNIFDYSMAGINCTVISDVQRLVVEILEADKPLGAICIAPVMVAKVLEFLGRTGTVTGGFNDEINNDIKAMGINTIEVGAEEIVIDKENKIVTTPAYVEAKSMNESFTGIEKLVNKVLDMI